MKRKKINLSTTTTPFLEKIIKDFDKQFYEGDKNSVHCRDHSVYASPFEIKEFAIKSHIKYLEAEELRLKIELTDENKDLFRYDPDYYTALENELKHKQQELLQAKELLK